MKQLCNQCGIEYSYIGICKACADDNKRDENKIEELIKNGHSYHCACRMVWGDGECESHCARRMVWGDGECECHSVSANVGTQKM